MWECIWTPSVEPLDTNASKILFYDAGEYVGILYDDAWHAWRVEERSSLSGGVVKESLKMMQQDWVPPHVYSVEEYPCRILNEGGLSSLQIELQIPGWKVKYSQKDPPCSQKDPSSIPLRLPESRQPHSAITPEPQNKKGEGRPKDSSVRVAPRHGVQMQRQYPPAISEFRPPLNRIQIGMPVPLNHRQKQVLSSSKGAQKPPFQQNLQMKGRGLSLKPAVQSE